MCKHVIKHLFDCELCGAPVSSDDVCYDPENNYCPDCKDETDMEFAAQFLPYSFVNRMRAK